MTPQLWIGITIACVLASAALWLWLWPRPRVRSVQADDLDALARAVTQWQPIFSVCRTHTGALAVTYSDLTVAEALDVGTQCIQAAMAVTYEHTGICDAEAFANGETP